MGLFIHLIANFDDIEPEQWEKTFQESVFLLEKFPAPLIRLILEEVKGQNRYVYTSRILENMGQEDENWRISDDSTSYRHAETFELFRTIKREGSNQKASKSKDVIFADDNHIDYPSSGSGIDIFGSKTQGYPYHLAILAVGILFESRFPQKVYVIGDIDEGQGENVLKWMNAILDNPVTMPVCLDGTRLWKRLDKLYDNKELAIKRFNTLSREALEKQLKTLLSCCDESTVLKYLQNEINGFSSLSQFGAMQIIFQVLNVTQDLNLVIEFIKNARPGGK